MEKREALAEVSHEIWAHWMNYLFSVGYEDEFGGLIIPARYYERWQRQAFTTYTKLTEREKNSDREQADKILAVLEGD